MTKIDKNLNSVRDSSGKKEIEKKYISNGVKILIGIGVTFIIGLGIYGINIQLEIAKVTPSAIIQAAENYNPSKTSSNSLLYSKLVPVTLSIDYGTGSPQKFKLEIKEGSTVFDLLKQAGLDINYTKYNIGIFINSIGGIKNNKKEGKYWMYYVNGKRAEVGAGSYIVKPKDSIEWKYEPR